ncbi:MAG: hypothetical protein ACYDDU_10765 [Dermatophilaceae bacterium]
MGTGGNDYPAMGTGHTTTFNCRYIGGEESKRVWSNHAYGTAIDVNGNPGLGARSWPLPADHPGRLT